MFTQQSYRFVPLFDHSFQRQRLYRAVENIDSRITGRNGEIEICRHTEFSGRRGHIYQALPVFQTSAGGIAYLTVTHDAHGDESALLAGGMFKPVGFEL